MSIRVWVSTAAVACAVAGTALTAPPAAYGAWDSFTAVAEADGLYVNLHIPGGPLKDEVLDAGSPRAQALLDSLGNSTAFAAAPWPGELVANASGLLSGPTGLPLPSYPMIASASHPTKASDRQQVGPVHLSATSSADGSSSRGTDATDEADTTASVRQEASGALHATAKTVIAGLAVGPLVLGRVEASATVVRQADGSLQRSSAVSVSGARISGQAVELTPAGISVLGTQVPVGPQNPALKPLRDAGVHVSWVKAQSSPNGVASPALEVTVTQPVSLTGHGSSTVRYTVGRAAARISVAGSMLLAAPTAPSPAGTSQDTPSADDTAVGQAPEGSRASSPDVTPAPQPGALATAPVAPAGPVAFRRMAEVWPTFYLPLVAAGFLMLCGAAAFRRWGVRRVWAS